MSKALAIHWFRQDLRLGDNPALLAAVQHGRVLPVYILDEINSREWKMGAASRWWLHQSLQALNRRLDGRLWVLQGDALAVLPQLAADNNASMVTWNRCYEPWRIARDTKLKNVLREQGVTVHSSKGALFFEPGELVKEDGTPYKVFTPFYKQALTRLDSSSLDRSCLDSARLERSPQDHSRMGTAAADKDPAGLDLVPCSQSANRIDGLGLLPSTNWYATLQSHWQPGEAGAQDTLQRFLDNGLQNYRDGRDYPAQDSVSRLSPYLHFGEISPQQALAQVQRNAAVDGTESQAEHFLRELLWREFSHALLYFYPDLTSQNLKPAFNAFPWRTDADLLQRWQQGQTGFPLVDAGMRELWQSGYMHNRVRMVVASFLVKNLMMHWSEGASWFWDTLVDADLANNSCSWQWVAGSGMDAAPYFRIFNPVTQSLKFDPDGTYIRRFVPELAALPTPHLHDPGAAPAAALLRAGIVLGETYPRPLVDLKQTRARALAAYQSLQAITTGNHSG